MHKNLSLFIIEISYQVEQRRRDEFGWIEGHEPGNGNYKTKDHIHHVIAPCRKYAEFWLESTFQRDGEKDHVIKSISKKPIDAIITIE